MGCYCYTCARSIQSLGIARHRAAHRDKKELCKIQYNNGDTYEHDYREPKPVSHQDAAENFGGGEKYQPWHSEEDKPLFIPLAAEHYEAFERGDKTHEYRAYGARWNEKTCYPGRRVVLSYGYGKRRRLTGAVLGTYLPATPSEAFVKIYGTEKQCFAIHIQLDERV